MSQEHTLEQPFPKEEASGVGCETMASPMIKEEYDECESSAPVADSSSLDDDDDDDDVHKRKGDDTSLSLPTGSLPPRKRAKTKDEKEQRRVERIMRNRQAAHASREKKRRHLEDLEKKCDSLSKTNVEMESQLQHAQRMQVESQEQHVALQTRIQQLESAIQMVKSSGDISVLEDLAAIPAQDIPEPVTPECTSPSSLQLLSLPSLSNSAGNSPAQADESEDYEPLDPFSAFPAEVNLDSSSKTHHPAAMV